MKKSIRFIINPISGIGKKDVLPGLIQKHLNHSLFTYDIVYTEHRGHAKSISKAAADEGLDIVCVAGGDGSVHEAGSQLIHRETALAILPTGSGNGVARHLGLSLRLKSMIQRLNNYQIEKMDTLQLNDKSVIGVSGFGFDALIAKKFDNYHSRGFLSYAKLVLKEFKEYKGTNVIIENQKVEKNLLFCSVANTSQFGNGFQISPQSEVNDGLVEIVCVETPPLFGFLGLLIGSLRGTVHQSKYVKVIQTNQAEIQITEPLAHIDGEPVEFQELSIKINCLPKSLNVII